MKKKELTGAKLQKMIFASLKSSNRMGVLERYAVFMGKAQIVEFALKRVLRDSFNFEEERLEKCTLGAAIHHLEKCGLRGDVIHILKELNDYRVDMAHNFLSSHAIGASLVGEKIENLSQRELNHALYSVQKVIHVFDFLAENGYLLPPYESFKAQEVNDPNRET